MYDVQLSWDVLETALRSYWLLNSDILINGTQKRHACLVKLCCPLQSKTVSPLFIHIHTAFSFNFIQWMHISHWKHQGQHGTQWTHQRCISHLPFQNLQVIFSMMSAVIHAVNGLSSYCLINKDWDPGTHLCFLITLWLLQRAPHQENPPPLS